MALNQKLTKIYFSGLQPSLSSAIASSFYLSVAANARSSSIINSTTTVLSVSSLLYTVPSGRIAKVMITGGVSFAADMYLSLLVAAAPGFSTSTASSAWGASITGVMQGAAQFTIGSASAGISSSIPVTVSVDPFGYVSSSTTAKCQFGHAGMNFQHLFLSGGSIVFSQSTQSAILGPYASTSSPGLAMDSVNPVWLSGGPRLSGGGVAVSTSVNPSSYNFALWGALGYSGASSVASSVLTPAAASSISAWQQSLTGVSAASYSAATFYLLSGESIAINYALTATVSGTFSGGSSLITSSYSYAAYSDSTGSYLGSNSLFSYSLRQSVGLSYTLTTSGGPVPGIFGAGLQFLVIEETTA